MEINKKRIISNLQRPEEGRWEITLRPKDLGNYIGQEGIKRNLRIFIKAAQERREPIEHVLLYGGPGLGKTTLAYVIAHETGANIKITTGPAIEKAGDLAAILTNLEEGNILFIDEIHRLPRVVEEILYSAMEEFSLDIVIGKGPSARVLRLDLPHFTLIGATTRVSLLSPPLRDRFGVIYHLNFYKDEEIEKIIKRSSKILNINTEGEAIKELAKRARKTPRIANRLLRRVRDYSQIKRAKILTKEIILGALEMLEIDKVGLDRTDRLILETIIEKFNGGPVGLNTIAASISEEIATVENIYEPFLIQLGFLDRTPRGRKVTKLAYKYLNLKISEGEQEKLI